MSQSMLELAAYGVVVRGTVTAMGTSARSAQQVRRSPRASLALAVMTAAVFATVALAFTTPSGARFDAVVLEVVQRMTTPTVVAVMGLLTRLGNEVIVVSLPLVVYWLLRLGRRRDAAGLLVSTIGSLVLNEALKLAFHRDRPSMVTSVIPGQMFSFPSGHAMVSVAFYGMLAVIGWRVLGRRSRIAWVAAMTAAIVVVGVSRLFLDVHYPSDVLASWAGGLLWLDLSLVLVGMLSTRSRRSSPARGVAMVCSQVEGRQSGENLRSGDVAEERKYQNVSEPAERQGRQEYSEWDAEQATANDRDDP